jgi:predicted small secreted protein
MKKTEWFAIVALLLLLAYMLSGCSTLAGVGKDITGAAEWTKEKVTQPRQEPAK